MKKKLNIFILLMAVIAVQSCTKLTETVYDKQTASAFYATDAGINASLAAVYQYINGDWGGIGYAGADRGWYDINELTTDEMMLPTRDNGGAWSDGGIWVQMYTHNFDAGHQFVNNTWLWLYKEVYNTNQAVTLLTAANAPAAAIAEAKVARAFFYYLLMDGWGSVPFYTDNLLTADKIPQASRQTIFNFVESELKANVRYLPTTIGGNSYGRFNKWAGYALLSRLYLNAQVYTGTARWADCNNYCDSIISSNSYSLISGSNYFTLFGDKCPDQETIMALYIDANVSPRNIICIRSLCGPEGTSRMGFSTWNGACAYQDFVNKYDATDIRKAQWETGAVTVGGAVVATYDPVITGLTTATTYQGSRNIKYLPTTPFTGTTSSTNNDIPVFRYAEILLSRAESAKRNGDDATALIYYNQVRTRAGLAAVTTVALNDIYDERGRELCWEGLRRQDMIRFGTFLQAHDFKPVSPNASSRLLFPIPTPAIATNPSLVQNPGY